MTDCLFHRGPDDEGVFLDRNLGLGFRRLAIIDLSAKGHQPMSDEKGEVWLVFNGEIYNFFSLRKELEETGMTFRSGTDTEVILHLYKRDGVNCLHKLRGMFAFAIWDKRSRELFVARDRLGKKPLKFYRDERQFIFASELKALFVNPEVPKEIDWGAIDEYLSYQFVPHPKTGFQHIEKLEPAHYLLIKETGEIKKVRYWQLDFSKKENHSEEEWKHLVTNALKESVRLRLMSDVPLGAHLSGGIDSSLVVALMAQQSDKPVKTFSIGFEEASHNELPYARLIADRYATDHHEFIVKPQTIELLPKIAAHFEEPFADSSALPTWILCELTRQYVTVAINGDGGDENFAGYARYKAMQRYRILRSLDPLVRLSHKTLARKLHRFKILSSLLSSYDKNPAQAYVQGWGFFSEDEKKKLLSGELIEHASDSRGFTITQDFFDAAANLDPIEQLMFADIHSYLPDDLLVKTDLASMAHALEIRSPLLDHFFMELVASMPSNLKLHKRCSKYLLKEIAQDFIPNELIEKPKKGFVLPLDKWSRESLHPFIQEQLLDPHFLRYGFQSKTIMELMERHRRGENHSRKLWTLLMLRFWFSTWFEG
jgi:asparagine synthase (glutamine-hydrolysing)